STTQFFLTDALGSIITTFNAVAGSAAVQGNQLYGPYGNNRYSQGTMGTNKGFTGQYADATGLDYYNARYYDPMIGQFLSADVKQGNLQGMDPYGYVGGNPETLTDPTGEYFAQRDDNGIVQNTGRLSNTTVDGQRAISVFTENIGTGKTIRSTVKGIREPATCNADCQSRNITRAKARAVDAQTRFNHEADNLDGPIKTLNGGGIGALATGAGGILGKVAGGVDALKEFLEHFGPVVAALSALVGLVLEGIAGQLTILQTTLRTLAKDFTLEGTGSGGWTIAGLENFKKEEVNYVFSQYASGFGYQETVNAINALSPTFGTNHPNFGDILNGEIETLFENAAGQVVDFVNAQERELNNLEG
ncbi:MAG TPA: RHS repeat-associated core domain-containing protein, partial [Ktedonosporobacter sp.]|nr:RHS repeat-associated core domain-containing protein [Ktedonosporobacter sp.]